MFHVVICILLLFFLYVSGSGSITSVGTERANLSAVVPLPLCAWNGLCYLSVALPKPSI